MTKLKYFWLHPLLLGMYPAFALIARNIAQIPFSDSFRAFALSLLTIFLLLGFFRLIFKNIFKAAAFTSLTFIYIFSYGQIYSAIKLTNYITYARHRILIPIFIFLWIIPAILLIFKVKDFVSLTINLNVTALVFLILPLYQVINFQVNAASQQPIEITVEESKFYLNYPPGQTPPDIYYIILDAYARDDSLLEDYGFDNSEFLEFLSDAGFYVAQCSQSNYLETRFSLTSSLNSNHLSEILPPDFEIDPQTYFGGFIRRNLSRQILEDLGYRTFAFETGFSWTELSTADVYFTPTKGKYSDQRLSENLNGFEILFLKSTAALAVIDSYQLIAEEQLPSINDSKLTHRNRVLFTLDQLADLAEVKGPKFVFAHIIAPHTPFVFDTLGDFPSDVSNHIQAYTDQIIYINSRMEDILRTLLEESRTPPIIILQGDHGGPDQPPLPRSKILNAYYLPNLSDEVLYPSISPVNSFRVIFNAYFGGGFELLSDQSLVVLFEDGIEYESVPDDRPGCTPN